MVHYFYSDLPITNRSSIVCPLTGKDKISTVKLRSGRNLNIHSLFVPIGRFVYPTNIRNHSTYVRGELDNREGYSALSLGTLNVRRYQRYWAIRARNGASMNIATSNLYTQMNIVNPTKDIIMKPGYAVSSIDDETMYVDATDNFKWKSKKILRMDGVKTITYHDTIIKERPLVVFDFEKLQFSFSNRFHDLMTVTKIYYVTKDGRLGSTETNAPYKNGKSDLEQLADTNPSYLMRNLADATGTGHIDGLILLVDKKSWEVYNDITLYCNKTVLQYDGDGGRV